MPRTTPKRDGVLLVDKPAGMTSHDVVAVTRRSLGIRRVGHTGTLDPFATGLLVLLVGQATRLARYVEDEPKVYEATIAFGAETDTDDLTGTVTREADLPQFELVQMAIRSLTGPIHQIPPAFSAKQVGGRRAYAAARAGAPLSLQPVAVTIHEWRIRSESTRTLDVTISCSGGTYVRALARDLGRAAHTAAHLSALRRVRSGVFDIRDAQVLDAVRASPALASARSAIAHIPSEVLDERDLYLVRHGRDVATRLSAPLIALIDADGGLVALAERTGDVAHPCVVMHDGV